MKTLPEDISLAFRCYNSHSILIVTNWFELLESWIATTSSHEVPQAQKNNWSLVSDALNEYNLISSTVTKEKKLKLHWSCQALVVAS
jgi:hypothetical protein